MDTKTCTQCGEEKPIGQFAWRRQAKGTRQPWCRECQNQYVRDHYAAHRDKYILKARIRNDAIYREHQAWILEYLRQHPCADCGEADPVVLEFDHLRDKRSAISFMLKFAYSRETIEAEIAKCEVVCANCHRRRTATRGGWYRSKGIIDRD